MIHICIMMWLQFKTPTILQEVQYIPIWNWPLVPRVGWSSPSTCRVGELMPLPLGHLVWQLIFNKKFQQNTYIEGKKKNKSNKPYISEDLCKDTRVTVVGYKTLRFKIAVGSGFLIYRSMAETIILCRRDPLPSHAWFYCQRLQLGRDSWQERDRDRG